MKRKSWIESTGEIYGPDATGPHCYITAFECSCGGKKFNRLESETELIEEPGNRKQRILQCVKCDKVTTTPPLHWDFHGDMWRQL